MELHKIIKQLQTTSSTNDKQQLLVDNKHNETLKEFLRLTYCPSVVCDIGEKTYPVKTLDGVIEDFTSITRIVNLLDSREQTGHSAIETLTKLQDSLTSDYAELLRYIVLKDARINVGAKSINKVWKNLLVDIPYQRCSLLDDILIDRINKEDGVFVQLKADGVFVVHTPEGMFTRNGNKFPKNFANLFKLDTNDVCVEGEIVWYDDDSALSRKVSNGITNSVLQGGEIPEGYYPVMMAWNILPYADWKAHDCKLSYRVRWNLLNSMINDSSNVNVQIIPCDIVTGMTKVAELNNLYLSQGYEGVIVKFGNGTWKYNTSKDCIKVKVEVETDMIIESVEEATGKNKGMVGRINVKSADGKVWCGVNATGSAGDRTKFWEQRDSMVGKIITCISNDLVDSKSKEGYSLFLGRADVNDVRFDKGIADDFERILEIFASAGVVKNFN